MVKKDLILTLLICCMALFFLTRFLSKPFWGYYDSNSAMFGIMAKNNLKYGLACTRAGQAISSSPVSDCRQLGYYMNHPILMPLLLTFTFSIFGIHEWAARLPFVFFSVGSSLLIFLIAKKLWSRRVGFFASLFLMATPMFNYFGKMISHEPLVLSLCLATVYIYIIWVREKKEFFYRLFLLSAFLIGISGWHGYLLFPFLSLHSYFFSKKYLKKSLAAFLILIGTFVFHLGYSYLVTGKLNTFMFERFLSHTSLFDPDKGQLEIIQFSWKKYLIQQARRIVIYFTGILVLLSLGFLMRTFFYWTKVKKKKNFFREGIVLVFLGLGLAAVLFFNKQVYLHEYVNFYFLPFFALAGSLAVDFFNQKKIFNAKLSFVFTLVLVIGVFYERKNFLDALQKSQHGKAGVDLARVISRKANPQDRIMIQAKGFCEFHQIFVSYYTYGWHIDYGDYDLVTLLKEKDKIESNYRYLITIDPNPINQTTRIYLDEHYEREKIGPFNLYTVSQGVE